MHFPDFYEKAPVIRIRDPFAAMLGAARDGVLEYRYVDAVRLAGHSCPTVGARSWWGVQHCALCTLMSPRNAVILPCICPPQRTKG